MMMKYSMLLIWFDNLIIINIHKNINILKRVIMVLYIPQSIMGKNMMSNKSFVVIVVELRKTSCNHLQRTVGNNWTEVLLEHDTNIY